MLIEVGGRKIEWDDDKAAANIKKHDVYFDDAARVFLDDSRIEDHDDKHSDHEDRWITIGMVDKILCVIYTERGETTRLISARKATKREKELYYGQYTDLQRHAAFD